MENKIHIAKDLSLPFSVTTNKIALLGGNGCGKTYATMKMIEEILDANGWVVILDPVGIYYGLRLDKTGQKPSGLDIPIFGGLHGDVILTPTSGKLVADLICDRRLSVILDVSQFETDADLNRFATDFGHQFWNRMKASRRAVTLVLEECQEFIPQNPSKGEERKVQIYNRIAKIGRNYGIGVMMISARPQDINKKSLNLTQLMFCFQMTGTHERKAMEEWFTYSGYDSKLGSLLPTLPIGEPYCMAPRELKINRQIRILPKRTFDVSATPLFDTELETIALRPLDISALQNAMSKQAEEARSNDPVELKRKISALELQLAKSLQAETRVQQSTPVEIPVFPKEQFDVLQATLMAVSNALDDITKQEAERHELFAKSIRTLADQINTPFADLRKAVMDLSRKPSASSTIYPVRASNTPRLATNTPRAAYNTQTSGELTFPQQRILDSIAWLESVGLDNPRRSVIAFLSGQSPKSSGFTNNLGALRSAGLIIYPSSDSLAFTHSGRGKASHPESPLDSISLQRAILSKLPRPQARILEVLIEANGEPVDRTTLAQQAGQSATSSGYTNNLGALRSLGVIDYPDAGSARALGVLWV